MIKFSVLFITIMVLMAHPNVWAGKRPPKRAARPSVYINSSHTDTTIIPALEKKIIRYDFEADEGAPLLHSAYDFLGYDFEVAMQVWLHKLGLKDIKLQATTLHAERADIIIGFGDTPTVSLDYRNHRHSRGHHQGFSDGIMALYDTLEKNGRVIPIIDLNSAAIIDGIPIRWFTIPETQRTKDRKPLPVVEVVNRILRRPLYLPTLPYQQGVHPYLAYETLVHELGHVFGLEDLPQSATGNTAS